MTSSSSDSEFPFPITFNKELVAGAIAEIMIKAESNSNPNIVTIADIVHVFYERLKEDYPDLTYEEFAELINEAAEKQE